MLSLYVLLLLHIVYARPMSSTKFTRQLFYSCRHLCFGLSIFSFWIFTNCFLYIYVWLNAFLILEYYSRLNGVDFIGILRIL